MQKLPKYRIESRTRNGIKYYYLIKILWIDGKRHAITKLIKSGSYPTEGEIEEFIDANLPSIEERARDKFVQQRLALYTTRYLPEALMKGVEGVRYLYQYMNTIVSVDEVKYYEQGVEFQYIHGTTAVEGNTLSYADAVNLLEYDIIPAGKSAREIFEVQNYKRVAEYRNTHRGRVDFAFIKKLHKLIMANILADPGRFRMSDGFVISGCDNQITPALLIEDELQALIDTYYTDLANGYNPFECAVMFHYGFESIHPFVDGNGRVGREILNYMLVKSGYPRFLVLGNKRNEYLSALRLGNNDDFAGMVMVFAKMLLEQRLKTLEENIENHLEIMISGKREIEEEGQKGLSDFYEEMSS